MTGAEDELQKMARYEALAEKAYAEMYETRYPAGLYGEMKDVFVDAIAAATRAGRPDEAERLTNRLDNCKHVFRKQLGNY